MIRARLSILLALSLLPTPASPAGRAYPPEKARAALEKLLLENIVPFWYPGVIDDVDGGYRLNHAPDGRYLGPSDKAIVTQARTVWFFSRLYGTKYGRPEHLDAARHGFRFLADKMWDAENGGFYWSVNHDGSRATAPIKHMYGQGFGLYALSEYVKASQDPEAAALARKLFDLMESKAHDEEFGGYLELFPRNWSRRPEDLPPGGGGLAPPSPVFGLKQMNTHLHLMEPMTTYYEVTGDDRVRARLLELITVESNAVVRKDIGACTDRYERDWTPLRAPQDERVSYGHDIENVWLLIKANAAASLPDGPLSDLYRTLFAYSLAHGWDAAEGGFYDSGPFHEDADRRGKTWWVEAEGLASALHMYRLTGDEQYYDVFEKTLDWIMKRQADWTHGDWHDYVGERPPSFKAGPWKSPYHNGRAVIECLELLEGMR